MWGWFPLQLTGMISLLCKECPRVFSSSTIWKHQFFTAQPSLGTTLSSIRECWKNHSFDYVDLVSKLMSLLFNILSRLVIALFPKDSQESSPALQLESIWGSFFFSPATSFFLELLVIALPSFLVAQLVKNLPANAGDTSSTSGSRKSSVEQNNNLLHYSCLGNSMDRVDWLGYNSQGHKSLEHSLANKQRQEESSLQEMFKAFQALQWRAHRRKEGVNEGVYPPYGTHQWPR